VLCRNDPNTDEQYGDRLPDLAVERLLCRTLVYGTSPLLRSRRLIQHRGKRERWILVQNRLLQLPQLAARLDPQTVDERATGLLVCLEGLGLSARTVQSEHQLAAKTLPQRIRRDERLELPGELGVTTFDEVSSDALFQAGETEVLEPGDLCLRKIVIGEVRERRTPPERQCLRQPPLLSELPKALEIQLLAGDPKQVAGRLGFEPLLAEQFSKTGHVDVQRLVGALGRVAFPERIHEPVLRDNLVRVQQQHGQQGALLRAAEIDRLSVGVNVQRAQDSKLHTSRPGRGGLGTRR
jgi:hypothetical protein